MLREAAVQRTLHRAPISAAEVATIISGAFARFRQDERGIQAPQSESSAGTGVKSQRQAWQDWGGLMSHNEPAHTWRSHDAVRHEGQIGTAQRAVAGRTQGRPR